MVQGFTPDLNCKHLEVRGFVILYIDHWKPIINKPIDGWFMIMQTRNPTIQEFDSPVNTLLGTLIGTLLSTSHG